MVVNVWCQLCTGTATYDCQNLVLSLLLSHAVFSHNFFPQEILNLFQLPFQNDKLLAISEGVFHWTLLVLIEYSFAGCKGVQQCSVEYLYSWVKGLIAMTRTVTWSCRHGKDNMRMHTLYSQIHSQLALIHNCSLDLMFAKENMLLNMRNYPRSQCYTAGPIIWEWLGGIDWVFPIGKRKDRSLTDS